MISLNRVLVIGNLVDNPREIKNLPSGSKVTDFRMAINEPSRKRDESSNDKDKSNDKTVFIDVTCWNRTAELVVQYLKRGDGVLVEGRLEQENWVGKDNEKRSKIKIIAERVAFMPKRDRSGDASGSAGASEDSGYEDTPAESGSLGDNAASPKPTTVPARGWSKPTNPAPLKDYGLEDDTELPF